MRGLVPEDRAVDRVTIVTDLSVAMQGAIEILSGEFGPGAIEVVVDHEALLERSTPSDLTILNPFDQKEQGLLVDLPILCESGAVLAFSPTRPRKDILGLARVG